jgi:hypothetical protein
MKRIETIEIFDAKGNKIICNKGDEGRFKGYSLEKPKKNAPAKKKETKDV